MIIFYNKKTGDILGTVDGRVHPKEVLDNMLIKPEYVKEEDVGKYVVPMKEVFEVIEEPIMEHRVVDKEKGIVKEVEVGVNKVKKVKELLPDVSFTDILLDIEKGKDYISNYKVKLDKSKKVAGLVPLK